ncbi:MAG: C4-dicarboxylate ABC transporter permease [Oceanibulbus sp.]|uniref:TRAP transporter large permease n=1 Tax=Sulfitobacter dubius TaxID=218673 RepID=UPI000C554A95|nr:C4-dicarboxylate ABC transporter permease [Sulfitobacter sp.]
MAVFIFSLAMFGTMIFGVPIAFAVASAALALLLFFGPGLPMEAILVVMSQRMFSGADSFPLLAIPLFFLAGNIMDGGGLSARLIRLADAMIGWVRGGLSMVVVMAEMMLAAIAGSPSAVSAAIGSVMIPEMKERGYNENYAAALVAAGGSVGPIIPPSIMLVAFGSLANASIADLFLAGIAPGIIIGLSLMVLCYATALVRNYPKGDRPSFKNITYALGKAILPIFAPVIILGGIFSGVFTATESAMIAVVYAIIVSMVFYRTLSFKDIFRICYESAIISSQIMFIISMAAFAGWVLASQHIPQDIANFFLSISDSPLIILLMINLMFLAFGCFIEGIAIMIILLPTILPVVEALDINLTFFGIMIVMNLAIGTITPPVGTCLIITSSIAKTPLQHVIREILPFIAVIVAVLVMIVLFPGIVTFIPDYFS